MSTNWFGSDGVRDAPAVTVADYYKTQWIYGLPRGAPRLLAPWQRRDVLALPERAGPRPVRLERKGIRVKAAFRAETATVLSVITAFKTADQITDVVVVADAGMAAKANQSALQVAGGRGSPGDGRNHPIRQRWSSISTPASVATSERPSTPAVAHGPNRVTAGRGVTAGRFLS